MKPVSSDYILKMRREYALYVIRSRALPSITDGLKAAGRRVLWVARDGHKWKSANLAGATMPIHPHASPEGAIDTLAAPYGNNITYFKGAGAFGTLIDPTAYGASRYTSVTVSEFTKDVIFRDLEIIPQIENYDGTLMEPVHFLPLIPTVLLNPTEGIAVGFATNILPRKLDDIVETQINYLQGKKITNKLIPYFSPLNNEALPPTEENVYHFQGEYEQHDLSTLTITKLPFGQTHDKVTQKLEGLIESGVVTDADDDSRDVIKIKVKFKRGYLRDKDPDAICKMLGLTIKHTENLNVLNFTGDAVWNLTPIDLIKQFTDWRLQFYVNRYERLRDLIKADLQRYYDIRLAIRHKVGGSAQKSQSRAELKELLAEIGIVNLDYIADLPIYRFTEEENRKNEERIKEAEATLNEYLDLLSSEEKRRTIYISELRNILNNYKKGVYNE